MMPPDIPAGAPADGSATVVSGAPPAAAGTRRRRIGILGGTFDPVHVAHVALGRAAIEALRLDELVFVPTGRSWQKESDPSRPAPTPAADRLGMVRAAIGHLPAAVRALATWRVDPVEVDRDGPSYTVDTLKALRARAGDDAALVLILGSDQLHNLPSWHDWRALPALAHLAVTQRAHVPLDGLPAEVEALVRERGRDALPDAAAGSIVFFRMPPVAVSSTGIRLALRDAAPAADAVAPLLPAGVAAYIDAHALYRIAAPAIPVRPSPPHARSPAAHARPSPLADLPPRVYLASRSARRRELLAGVGIDVELLLDPDEARAEALEATRPGESPTNYVERVVRAKAEAACRLLRALPAPQPVPVVCADTTVAVGGRILGKPVDDDDARAMLRLLSGRHHRVLTGVAVVTPALDGRRATPRIEQRLQVSRVGFARLDERTIAAYVAGGEPRGKAGGYALQGAAAAFVRQIEGSYSGVVGLPLHETCVLLARAARRLG